MFVFCSNSSFYILAAAHQKHTQTAIDATQKETAIDQQQHNCETLICRHQTILRFLSNTATASTRWWVRELNCPTTYERTEINATKRNKPTFNENSCSCPHATPCLSKRSDTVLKTCSLDPHVDYRFLRMWTSVLFFFRQCCLNDVLQNKEIHIFPIVLDVHMYTLWQGMLPVSVP